ncbi:MAG: hypothetical protein HY042_05310, partial [Spirochaetia bacterium]|nr:hypothetical protein [Spirochaetia bacterium]
MRTVLLTAVKEELECVLAVAPFQFDREIRAYRCLTDRNLIAATTGPGLKQRKDIRLILEMHEPDIIVNAGLVGILSEEDTIQPGERLRLGSVILAADGTEYPAGPGGHDRLVTVPKPVFDPADKLDLKTQWKARACDMEAAQVIALVGQIRTVAPTAAVALCKVAGDLPIHHELFKDEYLL